MSGGVVVSTHRVDVTESHPYPLGTLGGIRSVSGRGYEGVTPTTPPWSSTTNGTKIRPLLRYSPSREPRVVGFRPR